MAVNVCPWPWNSRSDFVKAIEDSGRYVTEHADGILGEYPGAGLSALRVELLFDHESYPTVLVEREHVVLSDR